MFRNREAQTRSLGRRQSSGLDSDARRAESLGWRRSRRRRVMSDGVRRRHGEVRTELTSERRRVTSERLRGEEFRAELNNSNNSIRAQ